MTRSESYISKRLTEALSRVRHEKDAATDTYFITTWGEVETAIEEALDKLKLASS